jgi:hypothetical protein
MKKKTLQTTCPTSDNLLCKPLLRLGGVPGGVLVNLLLARLSDQAPISLEPCHWSANGY